MVPLHIQLAHSTLRGVIKRLQDSVDAEACDGLSIERLFAGWMQGVQVLRRNDGSYRKAALRVRSTSVGSAA